MDCIVYPADGLHGSISLPGDKSLSHRALLFSAMAEGTSKIDHFLLAGVTRPMLHAMELLGVKWEMQDNTLIVYGQGMASWKDAESVIHCGNSATTIRLLAGAMAATRTAGILDGSDGLRKRPMRRIVEPMQKMGINIQSTNGHAPLILNKPATLIKGIEYELPIASAQVKTCLILSALAGDRPSTFIEPGPSRDHTERMLKVMGAQIDSDVIAENGNKKYRVSVTPLDYPLKPLQINLPSDISSAAFFIVAALITPNSQVAIQQVGLNPTRAGILEVLHQMNGNWSAENVTLQGGEEMGDLLVATSRLKGVEVSGDIVVRMIDEFPIFGIAAVYADGETVVTQAEELRYKESDRIAMLCQELSKIGADVTELTDGFRIRGRGKILGGEVDAHGDHRLAMALMVAGLAAEHPILVHGAEVVHESLPEFIPLMRSLGAQITCLE